MDDLLVVKDHLDVVARGQPRNDDRQIHFRSVSISLFDRHRGFGLSFVLNCKNATLVIFGKLALLGNLVVRSTFRLLFDITEMVPQPERRLPIGLSLRVIRIPPLSWGHRLLLLVRLSGWLVGCRLFELV